MSLSQSHESKGRRRLSLGCFPGHQPALSFLRSSDTSICCHPSWLRVAPGEGVCRTKTWMWDLGLLTRVQPDPVDKVLLPLRSCWGVAELGYLHREFPPCLN